ncbi:MAG: hypothetical protein ACTSWL_02570, partial [Promethearchaeota archaeon]
IIADALALDEDQSDFPHLLGTDWLSPFGTSRVRNAGKYLLSLLDYFNMNDEQFKEFLLRLGDTA